MKTFKYQLVTYLCITFLVACAGAGGERDPNRGLRTGAAGGAIMGLALGAVTGDATLAAQGAVAGAAVGGAAGAAADYRNDREDYRNENANRNININAPSGVTGQQAATPQRWDRLDDLTGNWQLDISVIGQGGKTIDASGKATGTLASTTAAQFDIKVNTVSGTSQTMSGVAGLSYTPEQGYGLTTNFEGSDPLTFSGEFQANEQRYNFYPVGANGQTYSGDERNRMRIEMRFAGKSVIIFETYVPIDGKETKVQTYRLTRS